MTVGARLSQPLPRHPLNRRHAHEVRGVQAAAETRGAVGRQHVVRADRIIARHLCRVRPDENRAGRANRTRQTGRRRTPDAREPRDWRASTASSRLPAMMMPPCRASDSRAGPVFGICAATARATFNASWRLVVISSARACGSCSACAIRSAAIHSGLPLSETMTISVGPA